VNSFPVKIILATSFALLAFSGNSILCRLALGANTIDAASFTIIRLLSGTIMLSVILLTIRPAPASRSKGSWLSAAMLFLYAATFSFAYISLETGIGALILFGAVQITMILVSVITGNKLHYSEWIGISLAFAGFVYLVMPGLSAPSLSGFLLMAIAGIAWGVYTLRGRESVNPISDTAYNFLRTTPFVAILLLATIQDAHFSNIGILLAILSGALASGLGYAVWYIALRGLSITQAAIVQLLVPMIAAIGGVLFANESISLHLLIASTMVLGGILIVVMTRATAN